MKLIILLALLTFFHSWVPTSGEVESWRYEWQHDKLIECDYVDTWAKDECIQRHPLKAALLTLVDTNT